MNRPRWSKVFHDLLDNKSRTILVVLTITMGVFAVGFVSNILFIGVGEMDADYLSVNPHAAILYTDPFTDDLLPSLEKLAGVGQLEGRSQVDARITLHNGQKRAVWVIGIPKLQNMEIDRLRPQVGAASLPPLGKHEVYLEQAALSRLPVKAGDTVEIELFDGTIRWLRLAAVVHDVAMIPASAGGPISLYTSPETLRWLGGSEDYNRLYLTVAQDKANEKHVKAVTKAIADQVEKSGRDVYFTFIYQPGRHFASAITQTLSMMMMFFGLLSVFLGSFLVINTVNALLGQQVRQIGVMKAVGAKTSQLMGMYLALVTGFGLVALAISIPLGLILATGTGGGMAAYLNFRPGPPRLAVQGLVLQVIVALVIPITATLFPVLNGTRLTIREAITNYGLGRGTFGAGLIDRLVERIRGLPRPLLISLRNTFRRKARLILTLSTLVLAGAIFIAVFNLRASLKVAIDEALGYLLTDVNVSFARPYRLEKVLQIALSVPGVQGAESWDGATASVLIADESSSGTQVQIVAPPAGSKLIKPTMTAGRWLIASDQNALVIGNHLTALRPELKVGDVVTLNLNERLSDWTIVGIYRTGGNFIVPYLYANGEYLQRVLKQVNQAGSLRIVTAQHDGASQQRVADQLEELYGRAGIELSETTTGAEIVAANISSTDVLVYFLLVMVSLIAVVGGLGLASTMTLNVIERTREVGVMRAIGASSRSIMQMVIVEGLFIGLLSWLLGALLAIPIGMGLAYVVGISFLQSPLKFVFSPDGFLLWLVLVVVISTLASVLPARTASRLTIREVLAYE